jgi:hypothetical protein
MAHAARGCFAASLLLFTLFPALADPPVRADRPAMVPAKPAGSPPMMVLPAAPPSITAIQASGSPYLMSYVAVTLSGVASADSLRNPDVHLVGSFSCRLLQQNRSIQTQTSPAGVTSLLLVASGFLLASASATAINCPVSIAFDRLERDGTWKHYSFNPPDPVAFTPDRRVVITDTQRLNDWLKPSIDLTRSLNNSGCKAESHNGKLAFRIAAHPFADKCTVTIMNLSGNDLYDKDRMPEGIVIGSFKWTVEQANGDACGFCPGHNACSLPDLMSISPFQPDDRDTRITEGLTNGDSYALFTGPPNVTAATRVVGRGQVTFSSSEVTRWHSYVYPASGALACRGWTAADVGGVAHAAGSAIGSVAHGQTPSAPPAPEGWLVLDEVVLYEPPNRTFP